MWLVAVAVISCGFATSGVAGEPDGETVEIDVRFSAATELRGRGNGLRANSAPVLERVDDLTSRIEAGKVEPLVAGLTQAEMTAIAAEASERSGSDTTNMANWYRITVPADSASQALDELRASPMVNAASPAPEMLPPPATPNYQPYQYHLFAAPTGIGSLAAPVDPRTRGAGITLVDLEYYWTRTHEDLQLPASSDIGEGQYIQYTAFGDEHGTAVFGILAAKDNGFGVTGAVPDVNMKGISPTMSPSYGYNPAGALTFLASRLSAGDVVLIEQQADGPGPGSSDYVPMEWNLPSFEAIKQLSNLGVIVVETGANGGYDLDSPAMLGRFDRNVRDSDAIMVGAGDYSTHAPLWFTSRGSRIDLQGFGNNIVTTGGNDSLLQGAGDVNIRYTSGFGGTSGAGPIVASAVVSILSYLKARGQPPMSADQIADLLRRTGTPQTSPELGQIGPLPDIRAALAEIPGRPPEINLASPGENGPFFEFNSDQYADFICSDPDGDLASCLASDLTRGGSIDIFSGDRLPTDQPGLHALTVTATDSTGLTTDSTRLYSVAAGCFADGVFLASVMPRGKKVKLLGVVDPVFAGRSAVVLRNNVAIANTRVASDGSITATVPAPRSKKARAGAGYRLQVEGSSSPGVKARNGARLISKVDSSGSSRLRIRIPGVRSKGKVTVGSQPVCGSGSASRKIRHDRRGNLSVRIERLPAAQILTLRKGKRKIQVPVIVPANRQILVD